MSLSNGSPTISPEEAWHWPLRQEVRFASLLTLVLVRILLPLLLLAVSVIFRFVSVKTFGMLYDEQITRAVAANIWKGDLSNNWKNAAGVPAVFQINCYNFSSYMYADALAAGPHARHPLYRERILSATLGSLAVVLFYFVALRLFGPRTALAALAVMAVFPLLVQDSHYGRPEAFVTFVCAVVYLLSVLLLTSLRPLIFLSAGAFCCGLLIACKISLVPIASIPLFCLGKRKILNTRAAGLWIAFLVLGVFAGVPDAFFHPLAFWDGVRMLSHHYAEEHPPHSLIDSRHSLALLFPYFWQTLGPVCCLLFIGGVIALLWRKQYFPFTLIAIPTLFYLGYFSLQRTFFERNLSHVAPLVAIMCAAGLAWLSDLMPRRARAAVFAGVLLLSLIQPALVSGKLVFVALRVSPEERASKYEEALRKREGLPIQPINELIVPGHVNYLVGLVNRSADAVIVPIRDYNDGYTRRFFHALQQRVRSRKVGYFPSLFPDFSPNTMLAYHSPNLLYIELTPPSAQHYAGQTFVTWQAVSEVLRPPVKKDSWVENGAHPAAAIPAERDVFYGSYTPGAGDGNRGSIEMGPIDVVRPIALGIPLITGPDRKGLSVVIVDHETRRSVAELQPPPDLPVWAIWKVEVTPSQSPSVDVIARDEGASWGEWLGIGLPLLLKNNYQSSKPEQ